MTLLELITSSLRAIGVKNPGVTLTAEEVNDAKEILNLMLDMWSAEGLPVNAITLEGFALTPGYATRTIGVGGNFNTTRPVQVLNAFVRSGDIDYPVEIIGMDRYQGIPTKTTAGRPYYLHYLGTSPYGTIYLYPVPDTADTLYLSSLKPLADLTSLSADITLPAGYKAALKPNLAVALCPEYGREPSPVLAKEAFETKKAIQNINAASRLEAVDLEYGRACGYGYSRSILEG
jgi:hypothetical protein